MAHNTHTTAGGPGIPVDELAPLANRLSVSAGDIIGYVFTGLGFHQFWVRAEVVAVDRDAGRIVVTCADGRLDWLDAECDDITRWPEGM